MTLYQEAGLRQDATAEEVREAYHALVRMLHPDQHSDPKLRALAEVQMRRINGVFEVLSDGHRRADYDRSLRQLRLGLPATCGGPEAPIRAERDWRSEVSRVLSGRAAVLVLGAFTAGGAFVFWLGSASPHPAPESLSRGVAAQSPLRAPVHLGARWRDEPSGVAELRKHLREAELELDRLRLELAAATPARQLLPGRPPVTTPDKDQLEFDTPATAPEPGLQGDSSQVPATIKPETASPPTTTGEKRGLAGAWVWVPSARSKMLADSYPPEYIELAVREEDGILRGRYRARFHVGDRAISPEVHFEFEGRGEHLRWAGNGGAKGDLRLELKSESEMEIHWITTEPGPTPALTSSSAMLVRRQTSRN